MRIFPVYFVIAGPYWLIMDIFILKKGLVSFLKDLFFISMFEGQFLFWYVPGIALAYLFFPLFYDFIFGSHFSWIRSSRIKTYILIIVSVIFSMYFEGKEPVSLMWSKFWCLLLGRIPAFIIGIYWGYKSYHGKTFSLYDYISIPISNLLLHLAYRVPALDFITSRLPVYYLDVLYALLFFEIFMVLFNYLNEKQTLWPVKVFGGVTYETYLMHMCMLGLLFWPDQPLLYLSSCMVFPFISGYLINQGMKRLLRNY